MLRVLLVVSALLVGAPLADDLDPQVGLHCVDGEMVASFPDSAIVRLHRDRDDSTAPVVTFQGGIAFGGRRMVCLPHSTVLHRTDSTVTFRTAHQVSRDSSGRWIPPLFSVGAGLSFNVSATHRGPIFGWMNRSIDSADAFIQQDQFSPNFEFSLYRMLGFLYSPGFGGSYWASGQNNDGDPIDLSYRETRWGPFLELPSRLLFPRLPPFSLRVSYQWIDGHLGLGTDTLRTLMIGYSGHEDVTVGIQGHEEAYSLLVGDHFFGELSLLRKQIRFHSQTIHSGYNIEFVIGARI